ncbi:conserved hypothetical protein [Altererythrobacter sp. B11]|uniref:DUF2946 family protein n=1 Tax=Altererythrobacter sp. B11 TaxID=2060312 RepID=UPI000DC71375|nr:DUF2946 family protein [Altererythrobacter sp. B11]BBC72404.1 conserved hypothetical protein [Altererythrobacter sp. B11]
MHALRLYALRHRRMAALLVALALCVKLLVPMGYMVAPSATGSSLTLAICNGQGGGAVAIALPQQRESAPQHDDHRQASDHCAFSALGMSGLAGTDPIQLSLALAFLLALGFAPIRVPAPRRRRYATPPLRGPPAAA